MPRPRNILWIFGDPAGRTFLAWLRTVLWLFAGALALHQLIYPTGTALFVW
ncbi:DUF202 domain-containing protein [Nocardia sp. NPDC005825]|uniref:DUF202 domain-containing protein n=1 Tax=unclassified Nocardia TaxID=2637762 RepID=UPI0033CDB629